MLFPGVLRVTFVSLLLTSAVIAAPQGPATRPTSRPASASNGDGGPPKKFVPATKEENEKAIAGYKKGAIVIADVLHVRFDTLETAHFLIFTDWDEKEGFFLRNHCENSYETVSRQFQINPKDNVFVGKLPIFMFSQRSDFEHFSKEVDRFDSSKLAGYFHGNTAGFGHMAMWKPDVEAAGGDIHLAEKYWSYVLMHEFTHAFVARYRTNGLMPRWLNEGLAEVIAQRSFPRADVHEYVRRIAANGKGIIGIFDDKDINSFTATDYPLAQTAVETLMAADSKAFLRYFDSIKEGTDPDDALQKEFHISRSGLEAAWKRYVKTFH